ncbi:hypothetical protein RFN28_32600 [Mesorhizobium sp. VK24D]|uniref:SCAN box domain-containing protein n=1 Tax=Mesorhizobium album TaxID=3072314 RepID=A0ABU4YB94_9HYPH|nr:hypothetical protein [Mesorhizobium sp. VK24D]MDX8483157.1 hypothetical protein [Mesorhizobium sp. VK24D]
MSAPALDISVRAILRELVQRLEEICEKWGAEDLKRAARILEELALESPGLEGARLRLRQALEADTNLLEEEDLKQAMPYGGVQ